MPLMAGRYVAPQHFNIPNKNNDPLYDLDPAEVATWERIRALVGVHGPQSREENDKLADTVIARRDAVAKAYASRSA
jgi:hypothetical protein